MEYSGNKEIIKNLKLQNFFKLLEGLEDNMVEEIFTHKAKEK